MRRVVVLAAGVVVLAAVAAVLIFRPDGREFSDVRALVEAMQGAGIECENLNVSIPDPTPEIVDFGSCQVDGQTVNLHVYKSSDSVEEHIEGNVSARSLNNPNYFDFLVAGDTWVVDTYSEETAKEIQAAIGGEIH
ncbi:MAG: hypothetical protein M3N53_05845 [Actinomycetota bacterium]|nr:hypothetical protein [Actinomycetota bacterium]